jgi:hypothetical protein
MMPGWQQARHLEFIAEKLMALEAGTIRKAICSVPVRHGKSVLASQLFAAWYLGRNPTHSVILASYSDSLATNHSRIAKHLIESDKFPFTGMKLSLDSTSVQRFNLEQGGGLRALGTGAGISGHGADLLILDDPLHDGFSEVEKQQSWSWYTDICVRRPTLSSPTTMA